tara:strand:- start:2576 stop:4009 length:1434 start_codon:yes stop_codon:yes gene_type:complete
MTETLQYAGEFVVEHATIITSENVEIDIRKLLLSLDLYEDIYTPAISGVLMIKDPVAMQSTAPLIGQEYLQLKIKTPSKTDVEVFNFVEDVFSLVGLTNKTNVNGEQVYTMNMITYEQMKNSRTRVNRVLEGTYSDMVKTLMRDDLKSQKNLHIEPTAGSEKIIPSNLKPIDLIAQFSQESISTENNSPTYLFYETAKGYHFRSLESMYAQEPKFTYTERGNLNRVDGKEQVLEELNTMQQFQVSIGTDTLRSTRDGVYGSTLITHDIFNKRIDKYTYNYHDNFKNEKHINHFSEVDDNPMFSATPLDENKSRVSDFPVKTFVVPVTTTSDRIYDSTKQQKDTGNFNYSPKNPQEYIQKRRSRIRQIQDGFSIKIKVKGNTSLNVGDVVNSNLDINAVFDGELYGKGLDRFYQGKFLVKTIKHTFDFAEQVHTSLVSIVKDSVGKQKLKTIDTMKEPRPLKTGKLVTSFYEKGGPQT